MKSFFTTLAQSPIIALMFIYYTGVEIKKHLPRTTYYFTKTIFLALYVYSLYLSTSKFMLPLIQLYGGWTLLGMFLLFTFIGFFSSFGFFFTRRPTPIQATPSRSTPC